MIIGIPKEVKNNENRVGMDPIGVGALVDAGHEVIIESKAGVNSSFSDEDYAKYGGNILDHADDVWEKADMIMKVKEPQHTEFSKMREGQILFTYFHLANEKEVAQALIDRGVTAVAYETIEDRNGNLPLLEPMSEVAGRMTVQIGAQYLEKINGGKGILLGGVPGTKRGQITIIGGGTVGYNAARMGLGLGAHVNVLEVNPDRRRFIQSVFGTQVQTLTSNPVTIAESVRDSDLVIGSVLLSGGKTPKLVTIDMIKSMEKGSVLVDPAIDQGGNFEGFDQATSHDHPIIERYGVLYYGVSNMPGSVPNTATQALAGNTVEYAALIAKHGLRDAIKQLPGLKKGVNIYKGKCTNEAVAGALDFEYTPLEEVEA